MGALSSVIFVLVLMVGPLLSSGALRKKTGKTSEREEPATRWCHVEKADGREEPATRLCLVVGASSDIVDDAHTYKSGGSCVPGGPGSSRTGAERRGFTLKRKRGAADDDDVLFSIKHDVETVRDSFRDYISACNTHVVFDPPSKVQRPKDSNHASKILGHISSLRAQEVDFVFYYSGHGRDGCGNLCLDVGPEMTCSDFFNSLRDNCLSGNVEIILDCCHAGWWVNALARLPADHFERDGDRTLRIVVKASSGAKQVSSGGIDDEPSLFTHHWLHCRHNRFDRVDKNSGCSCARSGCYLGKAMSIYVDIFYYSVLAGRSREKKNLGRKMPPRKFFKKTTKGFSFKNYAIGRPAGEIDEQVKKEIADHQRTLARQTEGLDGEEAPFEVDLRSPREDMVRADWDDEGGELEPGQRPVIMSRLFRV